MRAVRVGGPGEVRVVDAPVPETGPGEQLIRVATAAVCGSDRKLVARGAEPPLIPGHEVCGWTPDGTAVAVHPEIVDGTCPACRAGLENRCPHRVAMGLARDGGLAEMVAVRTRQLLPLDGVDLAVAPLLEPLACCLHASTQLEAAEGDLAVVVGAGPMGVLAMWALQAAGATVAVCQRSPTRRERASELGADAVLGPDEDPGSVLGDPPRLAVVTAPGPEALTWALERVAVGGAVHAFAGSSGGAPVDANLVHYRHLSLVGSTGSTLADYRRARELVAAGAVKLDRMPVEVVGLDEVPDVLAGDAGGFKTVVDIGGVT